VELLRPVRLRNLSSKDKERILRRASIDISGIETKVKDIIRRVKEIGDDEIVDFYERFFGRPVLDKKNIRVYSEEFEKAYESVPEELIDSLKYAKKNIEEFHKRQLPPEVWFFEVTEGVFVGQIWKPLETIGIYIPGGRAAYPSTVLMTVIPAKVAGVPRIVVCTPPRSDGTVHPAILVALDILGVREVYRVGGAHAIAAMAFGTQTIPKVDKIVGPGNIWVTAAKKLLRNEVEIDFIAGPSEILIIADDSANPQYIAADMVAQAEHDPSAAAVLITTSSTLARRVSEEITRLVEKSPRRSIIEEALRRYGAIIIVDNLDEAFDFANEYAPEHIEIVVQGLTMAEILRKIRNAGSIFIGSYTPVALGDYVIGSNHVLPTSMIAKRRGGLSVFDFIKIIDFQYVTLKGFRKACEQAMILAEAEGLFEHKNSLKIRLEREEL